MDSSGWRMDTSHWTLLKSRLLGELVSLTKHMEAQDWNPKTNRKVDNILSRRALVLARELELPVLPPGHVYFVHLWFKDTGPQLKAFHAIPRKRAI